MRNPLMFLDRDGTPAPLHELSDAAFDPIWLGQKLSNLRRVQGHPLAFSVETHLRLCAVIAMSLDYAPSMVRACLTHDLAEAFTGDWHGPSKPQACRDLEHQVEAELRARGWFVAADLPEVKRVDQLAWEEELRHIWPARYGAREYQIPAVSFADLVKTFGAFEP